MEAAPSPGAVTTLQADRFGEGNPVVVVTDMCFTDILVRGKRAGLTARLKRSYIIYFDCAAAGKRHFYG